MCSKPQESPAPGADTPDQRVISRRGNMASCDLDVTPAGTRAILWLFLTDELALS